MKRLLVIFSILLLGLAAQAQSPVVTITAANDTTVTVEPIVGKSTLTIKADVTPLVASKTTSDTIFVKRFLWSPAEAKYYTAGDTIVTTNATPNTAIKTYTGNVFDYIELTTYTDTTSTSTLKVYIK